MRKRRRPSSKKEEESQGRRSDPGHKEVRADGRRRQDRHLGVRPDHLPERRHGRGRDRRRRRRWWRRRRHGRRRAEGQGVAGLFEMAVEGSGAAGARRRWRRRRRRGPRGRRRRADGGRDTGGVRVPVGGGGRGEGVPGERGQARGGLHVQAGADARVIFLLLLKGRRRSKKERRRLCRRSRDAIVENEKEERIGPLFTFPLSVFPALSCFALSVNP